VVDPEDADRHRDGQFKIVAGGGEGEGGRPAIVGTGLRAHPEAHQKHDDEIDQQRDGDQCHVPGLFDDLLALHREHDHNREEECHQRHRRDPRDERFMVPRLPAQFHQDETRNHPRQEWDA
jgi:hypothetical protein